MAKMRINANFYTVSANVFERIPKDKKEELEDDPFWKHHDYWYVTKRLPDNRLYSGWGASHPTKITPDDLPENYVLMRGYKKNGYIRTAGVKDIIYHESPFHNHAFKDDSLYISYTGKLPEYRPGDWGPESVYAKCDEDIFGGDIVDFILAVEKYSPEFVVSDIKRRMVDQYNAYIEEMQNQGWHETGKPIKALEDLRHDK